MAHAAAATRIGMASCRVHFLRRLSSQLLQAERQLPACIAADVAPRFMIEATVRGRHIEGAPLKWSDEKVWLMARDGRLWDFAPEEATQYRKSASYFSPYSAREIAALLQLELGQKFEVTTTEHYLVCHPPGQAANWGDRFEQMYRQFGHYFNVRGLNLRQPEIPMVAIVFNSRIDFLHYGMGDGFRPGPEVLGYYSPRTNRVAMYDRTESRATPGDWRQNAAMLVHEAARIKRPLQHRRSQPAQFAAAMASPRAWPRCSRPRGRVEFRPISTTLRSGESRPAGRLSPVRQQQSLARLDSIAGDFRSYVHARRRRGVRPELGADFLLERKRAGGLQQIPGDDRRAAGLPLLRGRRPNRRFLARIRQRLENARRPRATIPGRAVR